MSVTNFEYMSVETEFKCMLSSDFCIQKDIYLTIVQMIQPIPWKICSFFTQCHWRYGVHFHRLWWWMPPTRLTSTNIVFLIVLYLLIGVTCLLCFVILIIFFINRYNMPFFGDCWFYFNKHDIFHWFWVHG